MGAALASKRSALIALACSLLTSAVAPRACRAQASEPPADPWQDMIAPDRPGASTPPTVLGRRVFQIETAFESQTVRPSDAPDVSTEDFPTLLRFGVGHGVELRVESNTVSIEQAVTGFADMSVEAKWLALRRAAGKVPSVAFLPAVSIPSGTSQLTAGKVQAGLGTLLGWALQSGTSLSLGANLSRIVESADGPYGWDLGSQGAFQVPLRRDWAISGDMFVSTPWQSSASAQWGADAGVEYYPDPNVQLDLVAIQTFTEPGTATAAQLGVSWRIGGGLR